MVSSLPCVLCASFAPSALRRCLFLGTAVVRMGHAGLEVTVDAGQGSAGAVTRVASGAYDLGFADINALIEYNAANPDKAIKAVMVIYDFPPFSVFSLKSTGIK